jgi:hypothetical protein
MGRSWSDAKKKYVYVWREWCACGGVPTSPPAHCASRIHSSKKNGDKVYTVPLPTNAPISDPKTLEQTPSEATAMSAERMETEAMLKTYWDEQRRTARERMLIFAELGEAKRERGCHLALPPFEILNLTGTS